MRPWLAKVLLGMLLVGGGAAVLAADGRAEESRRRELLAEMRRLFPRSEPWEAWLEATGELPPDFSVMPGQPFLPDPLRFGSGEKVVALTWKARRREIMALFQEAVLGTVPPSPKDVRAVARESREEVGCFVEAATLEFGPEYGARLGVEMIIPKVPGPYPVFLASEAQRQWALIAVSRGYLACLYAGSDVRDPTVEWGRVWPLYDWAALIRRAWAASRCVDYLETLPFVDAKRIAVVGHGSDGKVALIAGALDPRIGAVVSSSSGAGGACSFRLFSEAEFGEGIELLTRRFPDWFHPRLRFYAGREDRLPVDTPQLIGCIAPRPCLIGSALNDPGESIWAVEQTYQSAHRVYELLERPGRLNLVYRPGGRETAPNDVETYLDWLDTVFERKAFAFPNASIFPRYSDWKAISQEEIKVGDFVEGGLGGVLDGPEGQRITALEQWGQKRGAIRARILWGLGEAPPYAQNYLEPAGGEAAHLATLLDRGSPGEGLRRQSLNIGNNVTADLYLPAAGADRLPAVIWLHPISVAAGYVAGRRRGEHPHEVLARMGFAVLAFDQIGNGSRLNEVRNFYPRYPHWSLLGKQVEDTLAAVEGLLQTDGVDPGRIYLLGYGTGAMTALHAAGLDERVAGVVAVSGVTSMRRDTVDKGTGGIARWAGWLPLQPRLGAFLGEEARIPYDYHEVLAMVAPRPALVFVPRVDYRTTMEDAIWCVEEAMQAYALFGGKSELSFRVLEDYNRFSPESQREVFAGLKAMAGL